MPLPKSKRQAALDNLAVRLGFIQVGKGYNTDAGLQVFQGEFPRLGPDDPAEAISIQVGDDAPITEGGLNSCTVPVEVWAIVRAGTASPLVVMEQIIADIHEAVEGSDDPQPNPARDRSLGEVIEGERVGTLPKGVTRGVTRGMRRIEGTEFVGAVVEYRLAFENVWGSP